MDREIGIASELMQQLDLPPWLVTVQGEELAETKKEMQQQKKKYAEDIKELNVEITAGQAVTAAKFELMLSQLQRIAAAISGASGAAGGAAGGAPGQQAAAQQ